MQRLLDPQDGMLGSLLIRKARSAHDLTAQAQRRLRTVVSELMFPDARIGDKQTAATPHIDHISRLPEELLITIFCYLDGSSIAACNQVRKNRFIPPPLPGLFLPDRHPLSTSPPPSSDVSKSETGDLA